MQPAPVLAREQFGAGLFSLLKTRVGIVIFGEEVWKKKTKTKKYWCDVSYSRDRNVA